MAGIQDKDVLAALGTLSDNLLLVIKQLKDGENTREHEQDFDATSFWGRFGLTFKTVSAEATKLAMAFSSHPMPDARGAETLADGVGKASLAMLSAFYSLPPTQDTRRNALAALAEKRQTTARSLGQQRNHASAVREFVAFTLDYSMSTLAPTVMDICMYIEHLMMKKLSPGTLANKLSHVRQFLMLSGGDMAGISHFRVRRALDAVERDKTYVTRAKPEVPLPIFKEVILSLPRDPEGITIRAILLTIFFAGLRQSEVAPHSIKSFRPMHHLTRADVKVGKTVQVTIKHAKNLQKVGQTRHITLHPASNKDFCPVNNITLVMHMSPTVHNDQAMFTAPGTTTPLPLSRVRKVWNETLGKLGISGKKYSLHSIRKTSSTTAYAQGCSEFEIQRYGGWASTAYKTYITKTNTAKVNKALVNAIS